jgi:hypothetical protein
MISNVPSMEPPSTTICSRSVWVCSLTLLRQSPIVEALLNTAVMIESFIAYLDIQMLNEARPQTIETSMPPHPSPLPLGRGSLLFPLPSGERIKVRGGSRMLPWKLKF